MRFLDKKGNPRSVKIRKGVVWKPLAVNCEIEGCNEIAYHKCCSNLDDYLGFPYGKFGETWKGCEKATCIMHTFMRPKLLGNHINRCRDSDCNKSFFQTIKGW